MKKRDYTSEKVLKRSKLHKKEYVDWIKKRQLSNVKSQYVNYPEQIKKDMEIQKVFENIDQDGSNQLDMEEMYYMFHKYNIHIDIEDLQYLFEIVDENNDLALNSEEFRKCANDPRANQFFTSVMRKIKQRQEELKQPKIVEEGEDEAEEDFTYIPTNFENMISYISFQSSRDQLQEKIDEKQLPLNVRYALIKELFQLTQKFKSHEAKSQDAKIRNLEMSKKREQDLQKKLNAKPRRYEELAEFFKEVDKYQLPKSQESQKAIPLGNQLEKGVKIRPRKLNDNLQISKEELYKQKMIKFQNERSIPLLMMKKTKFPGQFSQISSVMAQQTFNDTDSTVDQFATAAKQKFGIFSSDEKSSQLNQSSFFKQENRYRSQSFNHSNEKSQYYRGEWVKKTQQNSTVLPERQTGTQLPPIFQQNLNTYRKINKDKLRQTVGVSFYKKNIEEKGVNMKEYERKLQKQKIQEEQDEILYFQGQIDENEEENFYLKSVEISDSRQNDPTMMVSQGEDSNKIAQ